MDIRDFLHYFQKKSWVAIVGLVLCTLFSGVFTYFSSVTYSTTNAITVGRQSDAASDVKFRDSIPNILADLLKNGQTAPLLDQNTGLSLDKDALYAMVTQTVNPDYQRLEFTVSGSDENTVKTVAQAYPAVIKTLAQQLFGVTNLQVRDTAVQMQSTTKPYKRNLIAGAVGGIGIGLVIIFIMLLLDDRFKDKRGIQRLYGIDYFGEKSSFSFTKLLLKTYKQSIRTIAHLATDDGDSAQTLYRIGDYVAALNKKVLIIDLSLASAAQGAIPQPGLTDLLENKSSDYGKSIGRYAQPLKKGGADVLARGTDRDISLTALLDGTFRQLIASARESYDIIFLHIPHTVEADKTVLMAEACDGTILSVREKSLTVTGANELIGNYQDLNVNLLGYYTAD